jgi:hypothetical protein
MRSLASWRSTTEPRHRHDGRAARCPGRALLAAPCRDPPGRHPGSSAATALRSSPMRAPAGGSRHRWRLGAVFLAPGGAVGGAAEGLVLPEGLTVGEAVECGPGDQPDPELGGQDRRAEAAGPVPDSGPQPRLCGVTVSRCPSGRLRPARRRCPRPRRGRRDRALPPARVRPRRERPAAHRPRPDVRAEPRLVSRTGMTGRDQPAMASPKAATWAAAQAHGRSSETTTLPVIVVRGSSGIARTRVERISAT